MFEEVGSTDVFTDDFVLLENNNAGIRQIYNTDGSFFTTRNIQDVTVTPRSANKLAYLDSEKTPNYLDYDENIDEISVTGYSVTMDKVRFHFVAGFDFDDFRALILSVRHKQNDGTLTLFANILFAPDTSGDLLTFNPKPLYLQNATFDRYIDIYVPSIKNINDEWNTAAIPSTTFVAAITPSDTDANGIGFVNNGNIVIGLSECATREITYSDITSYDIFEVSEQYVATLPQTNEFDTVGALIQESSEGDYIEYFLTFNSGFPADLIALLNNRNPSDDWIIVHQLSVYEQVGTAFINSSRQVVFQEEDFDEPQLFRPVLKNANEAVSMSIDYLVRLLNRRNGDQIIREASMSLISPKKYGRELIKIPLQGDAPQSQIIYNKLIKKDFEASKLFIEPDEIGSTEGEIPGIGFRPGTQTVFVPLFFNFNSINLSNLNITTKTQDDKDEIIFGQGKMRFVLSPFDNVLKFKVYTFDDDKAIPFDLNLNTGYRVVFNNSEGKVKFDNLKDQSRENLDVGEIVFKIPKKESESIVESGNREFYLTAVSDDGTETMLYSGQWNLASEQDQVDAAIESARKDTEERKRRDAKITDISDKMLAAETTLKTERAKVKNIGKGITLEIPGFIQKKVAKLASSANKFKVTKDISRKNQDVRVDRVTKKTKNEQNNEEQSDNTTGG
jgi:hypothetical protein